MMPEYEPIFIDRESFSCGYNFDREPGIYVGGGNSNARHIRTRSSMRDGDKR